MGEVIVAYLIAVVATLFFVVAVLLLSVSQREARELAAQIDDLTASRDAARHEANEYRADAADLQKKLTGATAHTDKLAKALDAITNDNTRIRADLHALAHKWK